MFDRPALSSMSMKALALTVLLVLACTAHAEKAVIIGHGATSCGEWLRVEKSREVTDMANMIGMSQWMSGYLRLSEDRSSSPRLDGRVWRGGGRPDHPLQ